MCHVFVFFLSLVKFVFLYFCLPLYGEIKICNNIKLTVFSVEERRAGHHGVTPSTTWSLAVSHARFPSLVVASGPDRLTLVPCETVNSLCCDVSVICPSV